MTTTTPPAPSAGTPPLPGRAATPRQLAWLRGEVAAWRAAGLVDDDLATRLLGAYTARRRASLARLLLVVGACFVGTGVIWLVAANLDQLSPTVRMVGVTSLWLGLLLGTEAARGRLPGPVVEVGRLAAVLVFGAVVFQAAQSLQVPAWEPRLLGAWAAGALLQAYAVRSAPAVVVGVATGTGWLLWAGLDASPSGLDGVLLVGSAGLAALAVGSLHDRLGPVAAGLGTPWRETGQALLLAALFVAAVPFLTPGDGPGRWTVVTVVAAGVLAAAAAVSSRGPARLEPLAGAAALAVAVALVLWTAGNDPQEVEVAGWLHAAAGVTAYVAAAVAVAVAGTLRDSGRLTALAMVALVCFTTFQAFAVFALLVEGAWLFLLLGAVLVGTGWSSVHARRHLARTLEDQ